MLFRGVFIQKIHRQYFIDKIFSTVSALILFIYNEFLKTVFVRTQEEQSASARNMAVNYDVDKNSFDEMLSWISVDKMLSMKIPRAY